MEIEGLCDPSPRNCGPFFILFSGEGVDNTGQCIRSLLSCYCKARDCGCGSGYEVVAVGGLWVDYVSVPGLRFGGCSARRCVPASLVIGRFSARRSVRSSLDAFELRAGGARAPRAQPHSSRRRQKVFAAEQQHALIIRQDCAYFGALCHTFSLHRTCLRPS